MATDEESKGFKVTDRRTSAQPEGEAKPPEQAPKAGPVEGPGWQMRDAGEEHPLPRMDFTTFCLSLASSAMIHLGLAPDPEGGAPQRSLPLAKQTIDILELLETKTRGNLDGAEEQLLETLLYDLRLRYLEARRQG
jgi:hypothetical protein